MTTSAREKVLEETGGALEASTLKADSQDVTRRELAHIETVVLVNPSENLGVIWGEVDEDEISALVANRSGFLPASLTALHLPDEAASSTASLIPTSPPSRPSFGDTSWRKLDHTSPSQTDTVSGSEEPVATCNTSIMCPKSLDALISEINVRLDALSTSSRARTRTTAAAAGGDLAVLGLRKDAQAMRLGVQVGWRAVALNGERLCGREQLLRMLKGYAEQNSESVDSSKGPREQVMIRFSRRIDWRRERRQLQKQKKHLLCRKREDNKRLQAETVRKKRLSLDLRKPLGIQWTEANAEAYGYQHDHLEVIHSHKCSSTVFFRSSK